MSTDPELQALRADARRRASQQDDPRDATFWRELAEVDFESLDSGADRLCALLDLLRSTFGPEADAAGLHVLTDRLRHK